MARKCLDCPNDSPSHNPRCATCQNKNEKRLRVTDLIKDIETQPAGSVGHSQACGWALIFVLGELAP
jgi:hypothetical protein